MKYLIQHSALIITIATVTISNAMEPKRVRISLTDSQIKKELDKERRKNFLANRHNRTKKLLEYNKKELVTRQLPNNNSNQSLI